MKTKRRRGPVFQGRWAGYFACGVAAAVLICWPLGLTSAAQTFATIVLAGLVVSVVALAEASMALQAVRLRAVERLARDHARELAVYADHCTRTINDIRRISPMAATEREAALTLDLARLHALGAHIHRQEHDARRDT